MPLNEIIEIACNYVYSNVSPTQPNFDRKHFKRLLQMATSGEFLYKDRLFNQIDGVAMGSPLGPTLANLFLANLERNWMSTANSPLEYYRYVDDIFAVFNKHNDTSELFLQYLNTQHRNLQFTMEAGPTSLPFLDTLIDVSKNGVGIS